MGIEPVTSGLTSVYKKYVNRLSHFTTLKHSKTLAGAPFKGAGGLHQHFLEIDFLVVSDREE